MQWQDTFLPVTSKKKIKTIYGKPGTFQTISYDLCQVLLDQTQGIWGQGGVYLKDSNGNPYGVLFKSASLDNLVNAFTNGGWEATKNMNISSGFTVIIIPTLTLLKSNLNSIGVAFKAL